MKRKKQLEPKKPTLLQAWYQRQALLVISMLLMIIILLSLMYLLRPTNDESPAAKPVAMVAPTTTVITSTSSDQMMDASSTMDNIPATTTSSDQTADASSTASNEVEMYIPTKLKVLPDLKLIEPRSDEPDAPVHYYEVENIPVPEAKLILTIDDYCGGEDCMPSAYRFLQTGETFSLLNKYSAQVEGNLAPQVTSSSMMDIPALDIPTQLEDPKTHAILNLDPDSFTTNDIFTSKDKTFLFTANGYNVFFEKDNIQSEIYYVQASDGKELEYDLQGPSTDTPNLPIITWTDDQAHESDYQLDPSPTNELLGYLTVNAESYSYIHAVTSTAVSQNDLMIIGTINNGEPMYGFKNLHNPILLAAEAEIAEGGGKPHADPQDIVLFWKDPFGHLIRFVSDDMFSEDTGAGKPLIYLYPTKPTNVHVEVKPEGGITKSDPAYNNGWNILAQPDGTLTTNGQSYPYLFWEGILKTYRIPSKGFVVTKTDVKQLLDNKLSVIGLNAKEIGDFEQFWLPHMQAAPYYFVTFTVDSDMEKYAPLTITPKPDTIIRVFMDYKPLQTSETVAPLDLPTTERVGFTAVEWGGALNR